MMELFFKKYFWVVHLVFIFAVAFLVARTLNLFVESAIAPLPSGQLARAARTVVPSLANVSPLSLERFAKLTGLKLPEPEPTVKEPRLAAVDPNAEPVKSSLRVRLLGTLVAGNPDWSFASIQDVVTQKSATYMIGDQIQTATVQSIERARVVVLNNGRREFIDGTAGDGSGAPVAYLAPEAAPKPGGDAAPPSQALGNGIKAITENEYEVPRAEIDKTLSNLNDVAMQARIVPAFKDGVAQGFKLFSIRPDSIYSKIGVQNGDVIRRINGFEMNSPEKALEIYSKLKEAGRIDIEIERNGSTVRKTYNVR